MLGTYSIGEEDGSIGNGVLLQIVYGRSNDGHLGSGAGEFGHQKHANSSKKKNYILRRKKHTVEPDLNPDTCKKHDLLRLNASTAHCWIGHQGFLLNGRGELLAQAAGGPA